MYLIVSYQHSPIYITHPKPVGYVKTLQEAKEYVAKKTMSNRTRNSYLYTKIKELK